MGSQLQQVLRSLCFNTGWTYAVLWRLKQQARMMFTWEDAYYERNQYPDKMWFSETSGSSKDGPCSHDPLGLAVAKMGYQVYSLGEGIIGQVAVSGKHSWIFSDMHASDSSCKSECFGGWQLQFSAGIKTIAVVDVIPLGVVQLGSLHRIAEDLRLVNCIRNLFSDLQDYSAGSIPRSVQSKTENSCLSDMCPRVSDPVDFHESIVKMSASFQEDEGNFLSLLLSPTASSNNHPQILPSPWDFSSKTLTNKMHEKTAAPMLVNETLFPSGSESNFIRQHQTEAMEALNSEMYGSEANELRNLGKKPDFMIVSSSVKNVRNDESNLYNASLLSDSSMMVTPDLPLEILDSPAFHDQSEFCSSKHRNVALLQDSENPGSKMQISSFSFCPGYELYEALGASFRKQNDCAWGAEKTNCDMAVEISEEMGSSSLMMENSDTHLLDAVVANVSHKEDITKKKSCYDPKKSLSTENIPFPSIGTITSAGYSFDQDTSNSLNSVTCGIESFKGMSSASSSKGSKHFDKPREQVKTSKKRARPGESCRPRPRDRQLIQDRIKELRELVPNGSKCSIDSLLERTVKHMLFLQSITKHAEKIQRCSASKLLNKDAVMGRFTSCEQGSSWAVEVGSNPNVCPIIVENMNMSGQMLVEMLCEECNQFLDVAETIRSLDLSILKGVSEAHGDKTWMCFVVEGQNNRSMHRMDILWSLMQLLQHKMIS